jgi:glycine dehydrogenase subunit 2
MISFLQHQVIEKVMKIIFEYEEEKNTGHLEEEDVSIKLPSDIVRKELPIPNVNEVDVVRHYTNLSRMNFGVDIGFYPLGSCTMKGSATFILYLLKSALKGH